MRKIMQKVNEEESAREQAQAQDRRNEVEHFLLCPEHGVAPFIRDGGVPYINLFDPVRFNAKVYEVQA